MSSNVALIPLLLYSRLGTVYGGRRGRRSRRWLGCRQSYARARGRAGPGGGRGHRVVAVGVNRRRKEDIAGLGGRAM